MLTYTESFVVHFNSFAVSVLRVTLAKLELKAKWVFDLYSFLNIYDGLFCSCLWFQISMKSILWLYLSSVYSLDLTLYCNELLYDDTTTSFYVYLHFWCEFRLVTRGIRVTEDQRVPVGSLALRGLLVALDHVACRGTEELQDLVAPRDQRYVANLSKKEWLTITVFKSIFS